jgi:GNAT superfamily N-acetyltransferase
MRSSALLLVATVSCAKSLSMAGTHTLARIGEGHISRALAIEVASYPADEAADEAKLRMRQSQASDYFWGAFSGDELRGFVCGTLSKAEELTDESMSVHEPDGSTLCIHSVVLDEAHRRQGIATWMLKEYVERVAELGVASRILLICKEYLLGFYESCGFTNLGPSSVVHGKDPWILMERKLP